MGHLGPTVVMHFLFNALYISFKNDHHSIMQLVRELYCNCQESVKSQSSGCKKFY